jgi:hypothetical protein
LSSGRQTHETRVISHSDFPKVHPASAQFHPAERGFR